VNRPLRLDRRPAKQRYLRWHTHTGRLAEATTTNPQTANYRGSPVATYRRRPDSLLDQNTRYRWIWICSSPRAWTGGDLSFAFGLSRTSETVRVGRGCSG